MLKKILEWNGKAHSKADEKAQFSYNYYLMMPMWLEEMVENELEHDYLFF